MKREFGSPAKPLDSPIKRRRASDSASQTTSGAALVKTHDAENQCPQLLAQPSPTDSPVEDPQRATSSCEAVEQPSIVHIAKAHLRNSVAPSTQAPEGRGKQFQALTSLLSDAITSSRASSAYVSGLPGTGKTFTVCSALKGLCSSLPPAASPTIIWLNCMAVSRPADLYSQILEAHQAALRKKPNRTSTPASAPPPANPWISHPPSPSSPSTSTPSRPPSTFDRTALLNKLKSLARLPKLPRASSKAPPPASRPIILVLDELDSLLGKCVEDVSELFMLPHLPASRLSVLGISNCINLTERSLPELKCRGCEPRLLPFQTYSSSEMVAILKQLLAPLAPRVAFDDSALQVCTRKVSALSGDFRRALKICCAALEIAGNSLPPSTLPPSTSASTLHTPPAPTSPHPRPPGSAPTTRAAPSKSPKTPSALTHASTPRSPAPNPRPTTASAPIPPPAAPTLRVTIRDVLSALSTATKSGTSAADTQATIKSLPLQQQLLLCAAASLSTAAAPTPSSHGAPAAPFTPHRAPLTPIAPNTAAAAAAGLRPAAGSFAGLAAVYVPLPQLYAKYVQVCKKVHTKQLSLDAAAAAVEALCSMSLLLQPPGGGGGGGSMAAGGGGKAGRRGGKQGVVVVALKVGVRDMENAFRENVMLKTALG